MPDQNPTLADVLRHAADLIAAHPDLPPPYITSSTYGPRVDLNWFLMHSATDLAEQKSTAARIVGKIGGQWEKIPDTYSDFMFRQERGNLRLEIMVTREAVCERVVTGVATVTVPAVAAKPERIETREIVEWVCSPLLAEVDQ